MRVSKIIDGKPAMSEKQFTAAVIELAQRCGWLVAHFRPALTAKGWRTAVQGDGAGFPDLVLARRGSVLFAELKVSKGNPTEKQIDWLANLPGLQTFVWTPAHWDEILDVLNRQPVAEAFHWDKWPSVSR